MSDTGEQRPDGIKQHRGMHGAADGTSILPENPVVDSGTKAENLGPVAPQPPSSDPALDSYFGTQAPTLGATADTEIELPSPLRISSYRILGVLGEGSMGVVYRAEQDNPRREVALKVLKAGGASAVALKLFEHEAQILGRLQHPVIAQIFEAGTADAGYGPQPFFAMEFIHGVPLKAFVNSNNLSVRARLELMIKVCDGVQHAHQKGVVHRDLKPNNILVDESGQPKILDFGIALLADPDAPSAMSPSEPKHLAGTLPYMSVEQFSGDPHEIDTRSDVYALGVIIYELLADRLPFDLRHRTIPEAQRITSEQNPTPLGEYDRTCRGDIESIVSKALEKDKACRFQSASDLAADIRRYLHDEPVLAHAPSRGYMFRKFAKRNRTLLAGLVTAIAALSIGLIQATIERNRAKSKEKTATVVLKLMVDAIESVTPENAVGEDVTVASLLDELALRVESKQFSEEPEVEAKLQLTLGKTYRALAFPERAWTYLDAAAVYYESQHGPDHIDTLQTKAEQALVLTDEGKLSQAEALCRQTLESMRRIMGEKHSLTIETMQNLGAILQSQNKYDEAEAIKRRAESLALENLPTDDARLLALQNDLALALKAMGDTESVERRYRSVLDRQKDSLEKDHPQVLITQLNLAEFLSGQGRFSDAEKLFRETLASSRRVLGDDDPGTLDVKNSLASLLRKQGRLSDAEAMFKEVLEARHRKLGEDHPKTLTTMHNLASLLKDKGELEKSDALFRRVLDLRRAKLGPDHPSVLATMNNLAGLLQKKRKLDEAETIYRNVLEAYKRTGNEESDQAQKTSHNLASVLHDQNKWKEAEPYYRESINYFQRRFGDEHISTTTMKFSLAKLLADMGEDTQAAELHREVLDTRRRRWPDRETDIARSLFELGENVLRLGLASQPAGAVEAEALLRECLEIRQKHYDSDDYRVANAENALGASLTVQGRFDEAEVLLDRSLPVIESRYDTDGKRTIKARHRLVTLYLAWNKPELAAVYWQASLLVPPTSDTD